MKITLTLFLTGFFAITIAAQDKTGSGSESGQRGMLDQHSVEISDLKTRAKEDFGHLDANRDGSLDETELADPTAGMDNLGALRRRVEGGRRDLQESISKKRTAWFIGRMLSRFDKDGSGGLNLEEFISLRVDPIKRLDSNDDGTVTRQEMRAGRSNRARQ